MLNYVGRKAACGEIQSTAERLVVFFQESWKWVKAKERKGLSVGKLKTKEDFFIIERG